MLIPLHLKYDLSVILKVDQDNVWADACLSKMKLTAVSLSPIVTLEQSLLTCASSARVILPPVNSGTNQVVGTARRMSNKGVVTTVEQL